MKHRLQLGEHTFKLDGTELGHIVTGADIRVGPFDMEVSLDLGGIAQFDADYDMHIIVNRETAALLERIGWTPPSGAESC